MLSPYPQLVRAGFRRYATYRQAALAGLTTNVVLGLLRAAVLLAVLEQRPVVAGYDVATAITFVWLGQGLITVVDLWTDRELSTRIRTGDVVVDLGRPWDLQAALLATDLGRAGFAVLARLLPPMAFGALLFPFRWPASPVTWLEMPNLVRTGELDVLLLRPLGTLPQILSADVALKRLGRVAAGLAVLAWALAGAGIEWTPLRVLLAATAPLVGAVIFAAIWVAANTVSFWLIDSREVANSVTYGSGFSTSYPVTVYGPWVRRVLCFAVPSAFVAYFPSLALLGRPDPLGLPEALQYSAPLVAVATTAAAALVWRTGVRRYQGTGS